MRLRLFHITEYAQSRFLSPETQREACRPWIILLLSSLWLAIPGNWALWRTLLNLPGQSIGGQPWFLVVSLAVMVACGIGLLLCIVNWHLTLKPVITFMLLVAAFNTHLLLTQGGFVDGPLIQRMAQEPQEVLRGLSPWRLLFTVSVLGVAPAIWLWRTRIRRVTLMPNLLQNISFILLLSAVLGVLWLVERQALAALAEGQPQLTELINPFNTLWRLTQGLKGE